MAHADPARDWDVFTTTTLARLESACASEVDFDGLRRAAEPHRIASYALLSKALTDPRYTRFQLSLRRWTERRGWRSEVPSEALGALTQPASVLAMRVLARLHRKALKEGAHFARLEPEARHDLRVTLKKLRYAAEFFLPVFAKRRRNAGSGGWQSCRMRWATPRTARSRAPSSASPGRPSSRLICTGQPARRSAGWRATSSLPRRACASVGATSKRRRASGATSSATAIAAGSTAPVPECGDQRRLGLEAARRTQAPPRPQAGTYTHSSVTRRARTE
jgi:hypothetical protein